MLPKRRSFRVLFIVGGHMDAIVLAGGEGTRLRPYTLTSPKPMLPINGKPMLLFVLENLKKHGITHVTITVGYLKEQIMGYFKDGASFGLQIDYLIEHEPQKTAGSIIPKRGSIAGPFIVAMGDTVNDVSLTDMLEFHKKSKAFATMCVVKHTTSIEYGVVEVKNRSVAAFVEKPVLEHYINAGIYVLEPAIFEYIRPKEDFAKDVFPRLLKEGKKIAVYEHTGKWQDIGRVSDYEAILGKDKK